MITAARRQLGIGAGRAPVAVRARLRRKRRLRQRPMNGRWRSSRRPDRRVTSASIITLPSQCNGLQLLATACVWVVCTTVTLPVTLPAGTRPARTMRPRGHILRGPRVPVCDVATMQRFVMARVRKVGAFCKPQLQAISTAASSRRATTFSVQKTLTHVNFADLFLSALGAFDAPRLAASTMPRSVYVVKGEGVRDSVWTPKTMLSSPSVAHNPELVHTVPSPNCSVNPVVQVFVQPPVPPSLLAPSTSVLCLPQNGVATPNVAPPLPSTSLNAHALPALTKRLPTPPNADLRQKTLPSANTQAASHLSPALSSPPNPASAQNTSTLAPSPQTARVKRSANSPFLAYNRSPMVLTVLSKQTNSGKAKSSAPSLQTHSVTHGHTPSRLPNATAALQEHPPRRTSANSAQPPRAPQPTLLAKKDPPRSPTSPVKQPRTTKKLSATEEAYFKEKRRALGDIVERRNALRREKSVEKPQSRPLTPISKLIEDASKNKSPHRKGLGAEVEATSVRVENPRIETPVVTSNKTRDISGPPTLADGVGRRGYGETNERTAETSLVKNGVQNRVHPVETSLQRTQAQMADLRAVENLYLTLLRSLFALVAQAKQEGRRKDGLSGTDLTLYMKKRVLAAFAIHTRERASVLNKKALKLLKQSQLCKADAAKLARLNGTEANGALQPVRRSKKSGVRREDILGLKSMLLSWERFRSGQKVNIDQFHLDVVHLKSVAEALEDGTQLSLSNDEAFALFKDLILVNAGIELIFDTVGGLKPLYRSGNRECVKPWFRSTDGILTWHAYLRNRMVQLLTIADEPFASDVKKYCNQFVTLVADPPDDPKSKNKIGDGIKIAGKLRELKKVIKSLGQDENGNELHIEDEHSERTTAYLTTATKSFAKLIRYMTKLSVTPKRTVEGTAEGSGGSSREGSPESKARRREDGGSGVPKGSSAVSRQPEKRPKRDDNKGYLKKVSESKGVEKGVVNNAGASQEGARSRAVSEVHSAPDDNRKRAVVEERRAPAGRGGGSEGSAVKQYSSLPSIPRRPAREDSGGAGARGSARSSGGAASADRRAEKSGPAATVQRMLANAVAPAAERTRKRKRGEGILQSNENEELDENGMRAGRRKTRRIGFRAQPDVRGNPPAADKESLRTLFSDGEAWMLSGNAVQREAIAERNARLSRETVDTWFGFLRTFVWKHKCMKDGHTFVMPRFLPNPSTPSAVRELARRVATAPLPEPR